ncbi:unnamed protein product [Lepeophtheirus salmonis]|uniref:(salmon louse) hypothetical protein n=1 Tax=Lepeophtheirus salmonis TaxID=72036 RepID=A0A7R8CDK7_LEPSM|nr:unnamed protein product [Lepeophtheirus salmonis]CAF2777896.1 unnamed protein product [Lepeophtheirus salmonis]
MRNLYFWVLQLVLVPLGIRGEFMLGDHGEVDSLMREGKLQYELIQSGAKLPKYGKCWLDALEDLHNGCATLSDDVQSRIALKFTNCFLEKAGLNTYPCPDEEPIRECLRNVDHNAFTAYSNFFMHCRSMCYFVMSPVWHKSTENRIHHLGEASEEAISTFQRFSDEMKEVQKKNLDFQRSMLENGTLLNQALVASRTSVKDMLTEFRSSTDEQRSMIFEIFDRVSQLQNLVLMYVLTATKRTAEARLWLFIIISINFGIERTVTSMSLPSNGDFVAQIRDDLSTKLYERVWNVRKCYDDEEDDNTSVDSYNSFETDRTFNVSKIIDISDSDTACENEETELGDGEISIYEGDLILSKSYANNMNSIHENEVPTSERKRPSRMPVTERHGYNLRSRRTLSWNKEEWDNPILDSESPNTFAKLVNNMAHIHKQRSDQFKKCLETRMVDPFKDKYSSDDD